MLANPHVRRPPAYAVSAGRARWISAGAKGSAVEVIDRLLGDLLVQRQVRDRALEQAVLLRPDPSAAASRRPLYRHTGPPWPMVLPARPGSPRHNATLLDDLLGRWLASAQQAH